MRKVTYFIEFWCNFLKYTNKRNLELDIYNDDLKIAIEYNGEQHYKFIPFFHKDVVAFENQQLRDSFKRKVCDEMGIQLICIKYTLKTYYEIKNNITSQLLNY